MGEGRAVGSRSRPILFGMKRLQDADDLRPRHDAVDNLVAIIAFDQDEHVRPINRATGIGESSSKRAAVSIRAVTANATLGLSGAMWFSFRARSASARLDQTRFTAPGGRQRKPRLPRRLHRHRVPRVGRQAHQVLVRRACLQLPKPALSAAAFAPPRLVGPAAKLARARGLGRKGPSLRFSITPTRVRTGKAVWRHHTVFATSFTTSPMMSVILKSFGV
jgi:hypothetical protein